MLLVPGAGRARPGDADHGPALSADPDGYRDVAWHIYQNHTIGLWRAEVQHDDADRLAAAAVPAAALDRAAAAAAAGTPTSAHRRTVARGLGDRQRVGRVAIGSAWGLPPGGSLLAPDC